MHAVSHFSPIAAASWTHWRLAKCAPAYNCGKTSARGRRQLRSADSMTASRPHNKSTLTGRHSNARRLYGNVLAPWSSISG